MKTLVLARMPAYPDEEGRVPQVMMELATAERYGELKVGLLAAFDVLFGAKGNPRRAEFDERDESDWGLVRKRAEVFEGDRWVVYELVERVAA